jgi:hypothetical protein
VVGRHGEYFFAYENRSGNVVLAKSANGGSAWTTGIVAGSRSPSFFPVVAVDAAGTLYVVWASGEVFLSRSTNGGRSWSSPAAVSPSTEFVYGPQHLAVFPWVVAGAKGNVDVSYALAHDLAGPPDLAPETGGPQTTWDLVLAQSRNATSGRPTWSTTIAAPSFHRGSICMLGTECLGTQSFGYGNVPAPLDRRNLDFFGMTLDKAGNAYISFTQDRPFAQPSYDGVYDTLYSWVDVRLARQTGGTRLTR